MGWKEELSKIEFFSGSILFDELLSKHTHFKIGGPATALALPETISDLVTLGNFVTKYKVPIQIIGLGSNLLVRDEGVDALCLKTLRMPSTLVKEEDGIRVGAGVTVAALLRKAASEGWAGFEVISGIPGTIGGIVTMNGGTHLGEASDRLLSVSTFDFSHPDLGIRARVGDELKFSYRKNHFLNPSEIIVDSLWRLEPGNPVEIREKLDTLYRRRKQTQPLDFPSCGSVFKNPNGSELRAWQVIDQVGLRGHRIGNAQFSEKHPNWILNLGDAKAKDVLSLIETAKEKALKDLGVHLTEEVRII
jgi:UDP-N-acetylmuramate dehydrogenase